MIDVSKFIDTLDGKPVAVMGLGVSNRAVVEALSKSGAEIAAWDDNEDSRARCNVPLKNFADEDMGAYACLVLSPGIKLSHPAVQKARDACIDVLCDLEILHRCGHGLRTIGITGTNGKSTTTALIGHILNACGVPAAVGGNIGTPALTLDLAGKKYIVLEISSYQADLCPTFAPDIAVHLNLSPDHIDHHGSMENYIAAKEKIFRGAGQAVIGVDDNDSEQIYERVKEKAERETFAISVYDLPPALENLSTPALSGLHNKQNMAAALQACLCAGLEEDAIIDAIKSFPGLPHRQYPVRTIGAVTYINDSKATNAAAAARALDSYDDIYWIVGGRAKEGGLQGLEPYKDKIRHAFLIGEAADDFAVWMETNGIANKICGTLELATAEAHNKARGSSKATVLLSPACASFDQFDNFEQRGDVFTALVNDLKEEAA